MVNRDKPTPICRFDGTQTVPTTTPGIYKCPLDGTTWEFIHGGLVTARVGGGA